MKPQNTPETGTILISALLFLFIITILTLSLVRTSLLESKMQQNYRAKSFALQQAEIKLQIAESILNTGIIPIEAKEIYKACGITVYKIIVDGFYHTTKNTLQSTFALIGDISQCEPKPKLHTGHQSWLELN
jgi:hypothetical protein